jgi:hypothetical protein
MQIDQGPGPSKTYFCKGLSTRAKYGTNMVCCVHDSAQAGFSRKWSRNWVAGQRIFVQPGDCGGSV